MNQSPSQAIAGRRAPPKASGSTAGNLQNRLINDPEGLGASHASQRGSDRRTRRAVHTALSQLKFGGVTE